MDIDVLMIMLLAKVCGAIVAFTYYRKLGREEKIKVRKAFLDPMVLTLICSVYGGLVLLGVGEAISSLALSVIGAVIMIAGGFNISAAIWRMNKWMSIGVPFGMLVGMAFFIM